MKKTNLLISLIILTSCQNTINTSVKNTDSNKNKVVLDTSIANKNSNYQNPSTLYVPSSPEKNPDNKNSIEEKSSLDEEIEKLHGPLNSILKSMAYNNKSAELTYIDPKKALAYINKSIEIYDKYPYPMTHYQILRKAYIYENLKDYENALLHYNKVIEIVQKYPERESDYVEVYTYGKELKKERIKYVKAFGLSDSYRNRGDFFYFRADYNKAEEDYNTSLSLNKTIGSINDPELNFSFFRLYNRLYEYKKSLSFLLKLNNYSVSRKVYMYNFYININDLFSANQTIDNLVKEEYKYTADEKILINHISGLNYLLKNEHEEARKSFERTYNNKDYYHNDMGYYFLTIKEYDKSLSEYNKAIEISPDRASSYFNRALYYSYIGEYDKSLEDCEKAISLNYERTESIYEFIGSLYFYKKNYDKAIEYFDKVLKMYPKRFSVYLNKALALTHQNNEKKALEEYQKVYELYNSEIYESLKRFYTINYYRVYLWRGYTYKYFKNYHKAIESLNDSIWLEGHKEAYFYRGLTFIDNKEYEKGINDLDKALKNIYSKSQLAEGFYYRAIAHENLNNCEKANLDYKEACKYGNSEACLKSCETKVGF